MIVDYWAVVSAVLFSMLIGVLWFGLPHSELLTAPIEAIRTTLRSIARGLRSSRCCAALSPLLRCKSSWSTKAEVRLRWTASARRSLSAAICLVEVLSDGELFAIIWGGIPEPPNEPQLP